MNKQVIEAYKLTNGNVLVIVPDLVIDNPRNWDNLGTMVCAHKRYALGDEQFPEYIIREANNFDEAFALWILEKEMSIKADKTYEEYRTNLEKVWNWIDKHIIYLPLYLLDHSVLRMRTFSFNDYWDSGQVGFIYCTKKKAREEWHIGEKEAEKVLREEVRIYDKYLIGEAYGWEIYRNGELIDSCYGYFDIDRIKEEFKDLIDKEIEAEFEKFVEYKLKVNEY